MTVLPGQSIPARDSSGFNLCAPVQVLGHRPDRPTFNVSVTRIRVPDRIEKYNRRNKFHAHQQRFEKLPNTVAIHSPFSDQYPKTQSTSTAMNQNLFLVGLPAQLPSSTVASSSEYTDGTSQSTLCQLNSTRAHFDSVHLSLSPLRTTRPVSKSQHRQNGSKRKAVRPRNPKPEEKRLDELEGYDVEFSSITNSLMSSSKEMCERKNEDRNCMNHSSSQKSSVGKVISRQRAITKRCSLRTEPVDLQRQKYPRLWSRTSYSSIDRIYRAAVKPEHYEGDYNLDDHLEYIVYKRQFSCRLGRESSRGSTIIRKLVEKEQPPVKPENKFDNQMQEATNSEKQTEEDQQNSDPHSEEKEAEVDKPNSDPVSSTMASQLSHGQLNLAIAAVSQELPTILAQCLSSSPRKCPLRRSAIKVKSFVHKKRISRLRARRRRQLSRSRFMHDQRTSRFNTMADKLARVGVMAEKLVEIQSQIKQLPSYGTLGSYYCLADAYLGLLCASLAPQVLKAMLSEDRSEPLKGRRNPQFASKNVFTLSPEAVKSLRFERKKRKFKLPPVFPFPKFKL